MENLNRLNDDEKNELLRLKTGIEGIKESTFRHASFDAQNTVGLIRQEFTNLTPKKQREMRERLAELKGKANSAATRRR